MAKGSNNSQAIKIQQESLAESKSNNAAMRALYKKQIEAAAGQEMPKFEGAAPLPQQSSADVAQAGDDRRIKMLRQQGLNKTVFAGAAA